jgi:hypothetical protein
MVKVLRHIVLFSYNDGVTIEQKQEIRERFAGLQAATHLVAQFESGQNNSPENLHHGFEDCFLVTFLTEKDRDAYLPHPGHQEFVSFLGPYVKEALVFDYWT